jgi:uncharacterized membrane protein YsdA (DUF1294 family)/cold shock CspA family protein
VRFQGRISEWRDERGFGFIVPNGGGEPVFLHMKAFTRVTRRPTGNELVTYEISRDPKGRLRAQNVAYVVLRKARMQPSGRSQWRLALSALFPGLVGALVVAGRLPVAVFAIYAVASLVAFATYAIDKAAARAGRRRTSEGTLQLLGLFGGWPGALAAQQVLRHKCSKGSFQIVFWATVIVNCGFLLWLLSAKGTALLVQVVDA